MVRQNNQDLQDKLLESETKVANLTAKLGTAIKCIEERDKTIVFRDAKIKSLTDKRDELHGLLAIQKAARASDRDNDTYLEKVRSNLIRGWYLCDRLEVRATSVWQTATGKSIGRTLITTVDITPTDVTNGIRVVRFHGTVLTLTPNQLRRRKPSWLSSQQ